MNSDISQEGTARTMEGDRVFSYDEAAGTKFEKMSTVQSASLYNQDPDINPALRHYVTGVVNFSIKIPCLKYLITRPLPSMHNGRR